MNVTIEVLYSCQLCGACDERVEVRERAPDEDIAHWMEAAVVPAVATRHWADHPGCKSQHCDLKLPVPPGVERLGAAARH